MMHATLTDVISLSLESSPAGDRLVGVAYERQPAYYGSDAVSSHFLGESYPVRATWLTGGLRDFDLTTARAPGDWPTTSAFAHGPVRI